MNADCFLNLDILDSAPSHGPVLAAAGERFPVIAYAEIAGV
jgi:hypothetical protein